MVKYLNLHNSSSFAFRYFFNVNGQGHKCDTPLVLFCFVTQRYWTGEQCVVFYGKISPDLKNMISIYTKGFYEKMGTNLPDFKDFFFNFKFFQITRFL
jgi:hypothetical protein